MAETMATRASIEADLRTTRAKLAALPTRRQWDIEPERKRLRARVERLLDDLLLADGQPTAPHA